MEAKRSEHPLPSRVEHAATEPRGDSGSSLSGAPLELDLLRLELLLPSMGAPARDLAAVALLPPLSLDAHARTPRLLLGLTKPSALKRPEQAPNPYVPSPARVRKLHFTEGIEALVVFELHLASGAAEVTALPFITPDPRVPILSKTSGGRIYYSATPGDDRTNLCWMTGCGTVPTTATQ